MLRQPPRGTREVYVHLKAPSSRVPPASIGCSKSAASCTTCSLPQRQHLLGVAMARHGCECPVVVGLKVQGQLGISDLAGARSTLKRRGLVHQGGPPQSHTPTATLQAGPAAAAGVPRWDGVQRAVCQLFPPVSPARIWAPPLRRAKHCGGRVRRWHPMQSLCDLRASHAGGTRGCGIAALGTTGGTLDWC